MLAIWFLIPLPFLNPPWTSGSSQFMYCWSLSWRILSMTLLAWEMNTNVWQVEHSVALPFFEIGMKTGFFQSCGHCWVFQICPYIECNALTSSFRICSNSAGIPLPPLALFIVILQKAHFTLWMSGSRWVTTPSIVVIQIITVWITITAGKERDGNIRSPDLPLEKSICRSGSCS